MTDDPPKSRAAIRRPKAISAPVGLARGLRAREDRALKRAKKIIADLKHEIEQALPYPGND